ncbi:hypothetical protein CN285_25740 [Bacillus cereus]|nr:hypothetical protein CN285_25740 [Bacillus cereus]PGM56365.1 hypothetical protein CN947_24545 [Bacillus cereus]
MAVFFYLVTCFMQLINKIMFTTTFISAIKNSTIDSRTYIWYNRNILLETMCIVYGIHVMR